MVSIVVLPRDVGKPVTKSTEMWVHGLWGTGRGHSSPTSLLVEILFVAHSGQAATTSRMSSFTVGHQNRLCTM